MAPTVIERGGSKPLVILDNENPGVCRLGFKKYANVEISSTGLGHFVGDVATTKITAAIKRQQEVSPSSRGPFSIGGGCIARWAPWSEVITSDEEISLVGSKRGDK